MKPEKLNESEFIHISNYICDDKELLPEFKIMLMRKLYTFTTIKGIIK